MIVASPQFTTNSKERGIVLVWAILSIMLIAGIIFAGSTEYAALDDISQTEYAAGGQAQAIAEAGVVDAFAWLRRQTTQPVAAFEPRLDFAADPEVNETDDPSVGLIRTFEIAPGLWARYTVARGTPPESFTDSNSNGVFDAGEPFTDTDGNGRRSPGAGTRDVSSERGLPGVGTVWLLESHARIFRRTNKSLPLGKGPNVQIASSRMATEVRRLTIIPPSAAAICSRRGDAVRIGTRGRVRADTAVAYGELTGSPDTSGGEVPGARTGVPGYRDYIEDVFGVTTTMLRSMADISTTDPVEGIPSPLPDFTLAVVTGDVQFTQERPLRGTGILIVEGDCTIESGANSFFNGVLYVNGNLVARAPTYLRGTVIVTGTTDVRGTGGDYCEIEYDPHTLSLLQVKMGQYRYTKSRYTPAPKMEDGRADESITITGTQGGLPVPIDGTDDVPPDTFQTDTLIDLIGDILEADPLGPGSLNLERASIKLEQARNLLMRDPPDEHAALAKVAQAMQQLDIALGKGADLSSLMPELSGGEGKLFDDMAAMVDRLIDESTATPEAKAAARALHAEALAGVASAQAEEAGGDSSDALKDYEAAGNDLKAALDALLPPV